MNMMDGASISFVIYVWGFFCSVFCNYCEDVATAAFEIMGHTTKFTQKTDAIIEVGR